MFCLYERYMPNLSIHQLVTARCVCVTMYAQEHEEVNYRLHAGTRELNYRSQKCLPICRLACARLIASPSDTLDKMDEATGYQ